MTSNGTGVLPAVHEQLPVMDLEVERSTSLVAATTLTVNAAAARYKRNFIVTLNEIERMVSRLYCNVYMQMQ